MLSRLVKGTGLVVASALAVPAAVTVLSPVWQRRQEEAWRPLGALADFPLGETRRAVVELSQGDWARELSPQTVYVWHSEEEGLVVFSRKCTDLGCPVEWDEGSTWFFCPCHGGIFDQTGQPRVGPPKYPLHRYVHRVREGVLEIDLASVPPAA